MPITLTIDDDLLAQAMALAAPGTEPAELVRQCLTAFIDRQTALRLAALGGQLPDIEAPARRRDEPSTR